MHNVRFLFPILISVPLGCVKFFFKRRITLPFIRKRNINLAACDLLENSFQMGAPVLPVLREVLEKVHKASGKEDSDTDVAHQGERTSKCRCGPVARPVWPT